MVERYKPVVPERRRGGNYFPAAAAIKFIPTGCTLLDCVIGGGWPLGRVINIVGDKSTGKTLLAIEACANFVRTYPKGRIWYREAEAAFDVIYASSVGLPTTQVNFGPHGPESRWDTVEDIFEDLEKCLAEAEKTGKPGLYVVDSLDALSSRAALERKVGEGTFGLEKPKLMSELFSKLIRRIRGTDVCLIIISQVRARIGISFGEKNRRSGGEALDFYASVVIWLSHLKTLVQKVRGSKRATGVRIKARCKKNKIAQPFREAEFTIRFGYGVDDLVANLDWLSEINRLQTLERGKDVDKIIVAVEGIEDEDEYTAELKKVTEAVMEAWVEIEDAIMPKRKKYG